MKNVEFPVAGVGSNQGESTERPKQKVKISHIFISWFFLIPMFSNHSENGLRKMCLLWDVLCHLIKLNIYICQFKFKLYKKNVCSQILFCNPFTISQQKEEKVIIFFYIYFATRTFLMWVYKRGKQKRQHCWVQKCKKIIICLIQTYIGKYLNDEIIKSMN